MPRKHNYRKIVGRNKIRDGRIIIMFRRGIPEDYLATKFKLTEVRIYQILATNHILIPIDKELERKRQLWRVAGRIRSAPRASNKDVHDWEALFAKLLEEKGPLVDSSLHSHFTIVVKGIDARENNRVFLTPESDKSIQ